MDVYVVTAEEDYESSVTFGVYTSHAEAVTAIEACAERDKANAQFHKIANTGSRDLSAEDRDIMNGAAWSGWWKRQCSKLHVQGFELNAPIA